MKNTIKILDDNNIEYLIKEDKIHLDNIILGLSNKKLVGVLDVSMIENLEILFCYDNKLTKIICNKNLKYLYCYGNKLTEIICNETLIDLSCHNNPILKLNRQCFFSFKSNIYIFDNKYYHSNKKITDISVKNNKKIMKIDNKIFLIIDNYPYDISNIRNFKESKISLYS